MAFWRYDKEICVWVFEFRKETQWRVKKVFSKTVSEAGGVGRVVPGINTTVDVGPNEIVKQAKKFGNDVNKDGFPKKLLRTKKKW